MHQPAVRQVSEVYPRAARWVEERGDVVRFEDHLPRGLLPHRAPAAGDSESPQRHEDVHDPLASAGTSIVRTAIPSGEWPFRFIHAIRHGLS